MKIYKSYVYRYVRLDIEDANRYDKALEKADQIYE